MGLTVEHVVDRGEIVGSQLTIAGLAPEAVLVERLAARTHELHRVDRFGADEALGLMSVRSHDNGGTDSMVGGSSTTSMARVHIAVRCCALLCVAVRVFWLAPGKREGHRGTEEHNSNNNGDGKTTATHIAGLCRRCTKCLALLRALAPGRARSDLTVGVRVDGGVRDRLFQQDDHDVVAGALRHINQSV